METKNLRSEDRMTPDLVFRDPYILDFLGLKDTYAERDLETAILREIESFILELGAGFAFIATPPHGRHRTQAGRIQSLLQGEMELYLAWLNRHERTAFEEKPIGLILCASS